MIDYERNHYRATIIRHVDADTSWVSIDPGFDLTIRMSVRWANINAPENSTVEGRFAHAYVNSRLPVGSQCVMTTIRDRRDKFGRYLGTFWVAGVSLNDELVTLGYAVPYMVQR